LWRISNYHSLNGQGGLKYPGRWHNVGRPVVYLAESPAGALLETLVHLMVDPEDLPDEFQLLRVEVPDSIPVEDLLLPTEMDWRIDIEASRRTGDTWSHRRATALARVPSALVPQTFNFLLNPLHPDARQVTISESFKDRYDLRLLMRSHR
jgi:RES domain-containing protein